MTVPTGARCTATPSEVQSESAGWALLVVEVEEHTHSSLSRGASQSVGRPVVGLGRMSSLEAELNPSVEEVEGLGHFAEPERCLKVVEMRGWVDLGMVRRWERLLALLCGLEV